MTTFHDPPPQSRRSVRQNERQDGADPAVGAPQFTGEQFTDEPFTGETFTGEQSPPQPPQYSFNPNEQAPEQPARRSPDYQSHRPTSGRRAQTSPSAEPAGQPEPLSYVTQGRPGVPGFDAPPSARRDAPAAPQPEQPAYRVRDFRPEGRRASLDREQAAAPYPAAAQAPAETAAPSDLDYHTVVVPPAPAAAPPAAPPAPTPESGAGQATASEQDAPLRSRREARPGSTPDTAPSDLTPAEQTMTRRELRELRAASEPIDVPTSEAIETLLESGPINIPSLAPPPGQSKALADAMAEFDALTGGSRGRRAAPAAQAAPAPTEQQAAPAPYLDQSAPEHAAPARDPEPIAQAQAPTPIPLVEPIFIEPSPAARPTGHWSIQAELDDESQPFENTVTRTVGSGSGSIATSALVLPSIPHSSVMNPFSATGAIIVTGSVSLPQSLGSTGTHPHRVDNSDYDDDPFDSEIISTDSAPVRAVNAVSTHTSTRGVIASKKGTGNNRLLTAMVISASAMAVGVVGLMAVAMANGMF